MPARAGSVERVRSAVPLTDRDRFRQAKPGDSPRVAAGLERFSVRDVDREGARTMKRVAGVFRSAVGAAVGCLALGLAGCGPTTSPGGGPSLTVGSGQSLSAPSADP